MGPLWLPASLAGRQPQAASHAHSGRQRQLHLNLNRTDMSRKHRYLRYFRTFNPRKLPGGVPPDPGNHENPRFSSILKGFGGFWGHQEHQGVHGDISREYGPKPWSGDPVQLDFHVFRAFFLLLKQARKAPEGSGSREAGREAWNPALRPLKWP